MGSAMRVMNRDGYETCGKKMCNMVHRIIDRNHPDWEIAKENAKFWEEVKEWREGVRAAEGNP